MGIPGRAIGDGSIGLAKLTPALRRRAVVIEGDPLSSPAQKPWGVQPILMKYDANGVAALGAAAQVGEVDEFLSPAGIPWAMYQTTAQTLFPRLSADGLIISGDLVNNEAVEYVLGTNQANNPFGVKVGTNGAHIFRVTLKIADVSGCDQFLVGWRKQEAFAVPTSILTTGDGTYTDFFGIGFASAAANPNNVYIAYDLNNGGSTTVGDTAFNWADGETHTLEVEVLPSGAVTVRINGVVLGGSVQKDGLGTAITAQSTTRPAPTFAFDSADFLVPFIFIRHDATTPGAFTMYGYASGPSESFRSFPATV